MKELERLSKSRADEARMVERAKIILGCLAGRRNDEIAADFGIQAATVGMWRQRILKQLEAPPPAGLARWDGGTLAQALDVSDDVVWRILRKEGIQLQQLPVSTFGLSFFSILCVNVFCMVVFCVFIADLATQRDDAGAIGGRRGKITNWTGIEPRRC